MRFEYLILEVNLMKDVLSLMIQLEEDVSEFYEKLSRIEKLEAYHKIFSYMSKHSLEHSREIREVADHFTDAPLNMHKYMALQDKLKQNLLKQMKDIQDVERLGEMLGESEGIMGYAYDQIAGHMEVRGNQILNAAKMIRKIAAEERQHKKQVLDMGHAFVK